MASYYGDSSALAKRYVREVGSVWLASLLHPPAGNTVFTALVTGAEVVAALVRRVRMGTAPAFDVARAIAAFRSQFHAEYQVVGLTDEILERAMDLAERHGLRGYDAIQLACALTARDGLVADGAAPPTFPSADADLNVAAAAEGLAVDDPNTHP